MFRAVPVLCNNRYDWVSHPPDLVRGQIVVEHWFDSGERDVDLDRFCDFIDILSCVSPNHVLVTSEAAEVDRPNFSVRIRASNKSAVGSALGTDIVDVRAKTHGEANIFGGGNRGPNYGILSAQSR